MSATPSPPVPPAEEEGGVDLGAVLDYGSFVVSCLSRHWRAAALGAAVVFGAALAALAVLPRTYRVETTILIQGDQLLSPLATGTLDKVTTTKGIAEAVIRRENLISIIRQTHLVERWKANRDALRLWKDKLFVALHRGPANDDELVDALVFLLEKNLVVLSDDRTVTLAISWRDPDSAYQIAAAAQQNLLETRLLAETAAITDTIEILESHVATAQRQVEASVASAQASRSRQARQPDPRLPAVAVPETRPRRPPEDLAEAAQLQTQLETKRRAIDDLEQLRRRRLAELQSQYTEQRAVYAESHPLLVNLRESINALSQDSTQLAQLRADAHELETSYAARGGTVQEPAAEPGLVGRPSPSIILRELPTRDPREELDRLQLTNATAKYNALIDRLNAARLTLDTARGSFKYRYTVVHPPLPPRVAVSPNTTVIGAAGLVLALALGLVLALALELRRGVLTQAWQIERLAGVRLLGELPASAIEGTNAGARPTTA